MAEAERVLVVDLRKEGIGNDDAESCERLVIGKDREVKLTTTVSDDLSLTSVVWRWESGDRRTRGN